MKLHHVRRSVLSTALPALLSLAATACGDDSTGPGDDELTQTEVEALVEALGVVGAFELDMEGGAMAAARAGAASTAASPGPAAVPVSETISETVPCPGGGNVVVAGTIAGDIDEDTGTGDLAFDLTHTHQGCKATAPSSGMTFTFDGDPRIELSADMTITENGFTLSGSQEGGIAWQKGDRSGSCAIDLTFDFELEDIFSEDGTGSVTGTVCGRSVTEEL